MAAREDAGTLVVRVRLDAPSALPVTVGYAVTAGTATEGEDYTAVPAGTLTFAAGTTEQTLSVPIVDDAVHEPDETLTVTLSDPPNATLADAEATGTIANDEALPVVSLGLDPSLIDENGGASTVTAALSGASSEAVTVTVTVSASAVSPAVAGDVTQSGATLTISAGSTGSTGTVTITAVDNQVDAPDKSVTVSATVSGGLGVAAPSPQTLTITDDEATPTVSLTLTPSTIGENGGTSTVTATLSGLSSAAVRVEVSAEPGTGASAGDFTQSGTTLEIAAGMTASTGTVTVTAEDNVLDTPDKMVAVTGTVIVGSAENPQQKLLITDDDALTVSVTADAETVVEGNDATFTVAVAGGTSTAPVAVTYTVGGTATADTDYTAPSGTLTLGAADASGTITIATLTDSVVDDGETLEVTLSGASTSAGEVTADPTPAQTTISDTGTVTVSVTSGGAVSEGSSATFTVALSGAVSSPVEVGWSTSDGTATAGSDYTAVTSGPLTFAADSSMAQTLTVATLQDDLVEGPETFTVALTGSSLPDGVSLGTSTSTMTIIDDDTLVVSPPRDPPVVIPPRDPPEVSIAAQAVTVEEGGAASFAVSRSGSTAERLTVSVEVTESGSFIAGAVPVEARFEANADRAILQIATTDDAIDEPDGSVTVVLAAGDGYVVADPVSATVTVTDNDDPPELIITDRRAMESAGQIAFTVRLSAPSGHRVTVTRTSEDGTASAGEDYVSAHDTLVFTPGQTSGTIAVPLLDDTLDEIDETFLMVLSEPSHATLGDAVATGTIEDDDESVLQAWLARFGRTVATHVLEAVGERLTEGPGQSSRATVAGRRLSPVADVALHDGFQEGALRTVALRTVEFREVLSGSSFHLLLTEEDEKADEAGGGPGARWAAWGRGAVTRLAGTEGALSLDGEVASGMIGADYDWGRVLAGMAVAYSGGGGVFTLSGGGNLTDRMGDLHGWLLSAHPYMSVEVTDGLDVLGLLGYGRGRMSLTEGRDASEFDISMLMGAFAGRRVLLRAQSGGVDLAMKSDGVVLRMMGEAVGLPAVVADVTRLRLALEGSVDVLRGPGGVLTPSLQVGTRYDGGAAETGAGVEVGGGLRYVHPESGLTLAANGELLLTHQARGYQEWGVGGSIQVAPDAAGRGLSFSVNTSWGEAASGVEPLWSPGAEHAEGVPTGRVDAELGYGLDTPGGRGLVTPYAGVTLAGGGVHVYRLGGRLSLGQAFSLVLEAERAEGAGATPEHGLRVGGTLRR